MTSIQQRARDLIALAEKATPGPWDNFARGVLTRCGPDSDLLVIAECMSPDIGIASDNARFAAAARNDTPRIAAAFLRAVELLRECHEVIDAFGGIRSIDLVSDVAELLKEIE
jgi:hypothetical protein